ncbi:MAG TPA: 3-oxoacyl-[acyl-carrier-protein] reductase [candidate division Zixibacteria bacterium]|nr:3-oxoacyl-[acyl-carrier-protein] reductase [candidate division Zixibacteria bacterium]MDD4918796.1 3-oxoacyl-[acyl-carrier-protein] reductase [candidate division Zixibacteria bacterium]HOZ07336.1 3-oxoacyl-[acyl-carrier-protein] reductase [candidate division Zixibacteria bacterium]HPC10958.1 3-oxoacyl-[acyl-carrier-protein] reductase [candidate division Zixibacteria bacterium]HPI32685.1 3-oxoacyl-[acyl-carrier-protein] reductase [candidate division Zixibacteria bacterium]
MDFSGKTVVVTGSARGIGRAIAERFARAGARVVISDVDDAALAAAAAAMPGEAIGVRADVTSSADAEALIAAAQERFGSVDVVVNNAGVTRDTLLVRMDEKDWDMVLDINLKGAFLVTKSAAKVMMKQRSGRIINVSSVVGLFGNAGQTNYAASKAGLLGLTKSAAKELGARGITVNAVAPGFIETDMTRVLPEEARARFLERSVIKRAGTPDDVAAAVMFLASDAAAYITGHVIAVDGGMAM